MNKQIEALRKLGLNETEIKEVLQADKAIDKGEKLFELTTDQKQAEKQARATGTKKPTTYNLQKRERKPNVQKREIIQYLDDAICDFADNVTVLNPEREILFELDDIKYKVVVSVPRK